MKRTEANYQDLLKVIALTAMIIDHLGLYLFPDQTWMRIIGRYAMPLFCFFAGYNFKGNLRIRIFVYGAILYVASYLLIFKILIPANILISIFAGLLFLKFFGDKLKNFWVGYFFVVLFGCMWMITKDFFDYGGIALSIVILGYMTRKLPELKYWLTFAAVAIGFIHRYFVFYSFTQFEQFATLAVSALCFISLNAISYDRKISVNLVPISSKMLEIYFIHLLIIRLIWFYYYISQNIS